MSTSNSEERKIPTYLNSVTGAIDLIHFGGDLNETLSHGRSSVVRFSTRGAKNSSALFLRTRDSSWLQSSVLSLLKDRTEKEVAYMNALANSRAFRWVTSGSDLCFTNLRGPSGGRNIPPSAVRSKGLLDFSHFRVAGREPGYSSDSLDFFDSGSGVSGVIGLARENLRPMYVAHNVLRSAVEDVEHDLHELAGNYVTVVDSYSNLSDVTTAFATTAEDNSFVLVNDALLGDEEVISHTAKLLRVHYRNAKLWSGGRPPQDVLPYLMWAYKSFIAISEELEAKGMTPTGVWHVTRSAPTSHDFTVEEFDDGLKRRAWTTKLEFYPRHGTSVVGYGMWNTSMFVEVIRETESDCMYTFQPTVGGIARTGVEKFLRSELSIFRGGTFSVPEFTEESLEYFMSSVSEPWHPGSPDPLSINPAEITVDMLLSTKIRRTGHNAFRLSDHAVDVAEQLSTPYYYLPLIGPLGDVDVAYLVSNVDVAKTNLISSPDFLVEGPIEVGPVIEESEAEAEEGDVVFPKKQQHPDGVQNVSNSSKGVRESQLDVHVYKVLVSTGPEWINDAAATGHGLFRPMKGKELQAVLNATTQFGGYNMAAAHYDGKVMFPRKTIESTELYRAYKKSREKACKVNNFMSTKFDKKRTWGDINSALIAQGGREAFYGLFPEPTFADVAVVIDYSKVTYTYQPGTSPAVLQRRLDTTVTTHGADDSESVLGELALGAKLSGITLTTLVQSWSGDVVSHAQLQAEMDSAKQEYGSIRSKQEDARLSTGGAGLSWDPNGHNAQGFPQVDKLLYQDALKAIIMSEALHRLPGYEFHKLVWRLGADIINPTVTRARKLINAMSDTDLLRLA